MNSFGKNIVLTTFGESHGKAVGGVIDGFPANFSVNFQAINTELQRRKTESFPFFSQRKEADEVEFFSGIFEGKTTGAPVAFLVKNTDTQSADYEDLKDVFRNGHADFTCQAKYGIRDYRGGGRASARETVARVVAGALAKQFLAKQEIFIDGFVSQIGQISLTEEQSKQKMLAEIQKAQEEQDSVGGVVSCVIKGVPAGVGEPVFDKLQARLAYAMLSIPTVKGFDYGCGFDSAKMLGSEMNDVFVYENARIATKTNRCGGILGGISTGGDIFFRVAFKPVSSIGKIQQSVDLQGNTRQYQIKGRHDVCIVPRAVPIVEAMAALVLIDFIA
ncbi:MAG: chorismate synthase [Prevotellaceae bacterium]|jgi:chorismate synthase|nr:chorismate synthase [Prevotellaceae bacterium]